MSKSILIILSGQGPWGPCGGILLNLPSWNINGKAFNLANEDSSIEQLGKEKGLTIAEKRLCSNTYTGNFLGKHINSEQFLRFF